MRGRARAAWSCCVLVLAGAPAAAEPSPEGLAFFERKVRPLFVRHCYSCHSASIRNVPQPPNL